MSLSTPPSGTVDVLLDGQGVFLLSDLEDTPSVRLSGHTVASERRERASAVTLILKVCDYLRLPINVASAAAIYLHRFYMRFSLPTKAPGHGERFPGPEVAATCVFLACKTEEVPRKLASVVEAIMASLDKSEEGKEAFDHRNFARKFGRPHVRGGAGHESHSWRMVIDEHDLRPGERMDEKTLIAVRWRRKILHTEMRVAESTAFEFIHSHPHTYLVAAARRIGMDSVLFNAVWWGLMDVLHDPILIIFHPGSLAAGMYLHACRLLQRKPFPSSENEDGGEDEWRNTFAASWEEVQESLQGVENMYRTDAAGLVKIPNDFKSKLPELYRKLLDRQAQIKAAQAAHAQRKQAAAPPVPFPPPPPPPPPPAPPSLPSSPVKRPHEADLEASKRPRLDRSRAPALVSPNLMLNYGDATEEAAAVPAPAQPADRLVSPTVPGAGTAQGPEPMDGVRSPMRDLPSPRADSLRSPRGGGRRSPRPIRPSGRAFGEAPPGPALPQTSRAFGEAPAGPGRDMSRNGPYRARSPPRGGPGRAERPPWNRDGYGRDGYRRDGRDGRDGRDFDHGGWGRRAGDPSRGPRGERYGDNRFGTYGSAPGGRGGGGNGYQNRNGYGSGWRR